MVVDEKHVGRTCHICYVQYREWVSNKLIFLILLLISCYVIIIEGEIWNRISWIIISASYFFFIFIILVIIFFIIIFIFTFLLPAIILLDAILYFKWTPLPNWFVITFNNINLFENAVFNTVEELIMLKVSHLADFLLIYEYRDHLIFFVLDSNYEVSSS